MSYAKDFMRRQAAGASHAGGDHVAADAVYIATGTSHAAVMPTQATEAVPNTLGLASEDDSKPRQPIWAKPTPTPRLVRDMSLGARVDRAVASLTTRPLKRDIVKTSMRQSENARISSRSQSVARRSAFRSSSRQHSVTSQKRSSSAPAQRQKQPPRVTWRLSLGQAMRQSERPTLSQHGSKLSVASKYITSLADVPPQIASQVQQLHLGNNSLRTLSGNDDDDDERERSRLRAGERRQHSQSLEPNDFRGLLSGSRMGALGLVGFANVRVLSLSNNQLHYLEDLVPLTHLPFLSTLALEGNYVARMPNYRAQLVHYLPKLEVLDTRAVARGERQAATLTIRKEAPLQRACFENAVTLSMLSSRLVPLLKLHHELLSHRATRPPDFASSFAVTTEDHQVSCERQWPDGCAGKRKRPRPLGLVLQQWQPLARSLESDVKEARRVHRSIQIGLRGRFCHTLATFKASSSGSHVAEASSSIVGRMSFDETDSAWERIFTSELMSQQKALVQLRSDIESLRGHSDDNDDSGIEEIDLHSLGSSLWGTTTHTVAGSSSALGNDNGTCYGSLLWGPPITAAMNEAEAEARAPKREEAEQTTPPRHKPSGHSSPPVSPSPIVSLRLPPAPMTPPTRPHSMTSQPHEPQIKACNRGLPRASEEKYSPASAHSESMSAKQGWGTDFDYREDREWAAWDETVEEVADELQHGVAIATVREDNKRHSYGGKEGQPTVEPATSVTPPPFSVGVRFDERREELGGEHFREGRETDPTGDALAAEDDSRSEPQAKEEKAEKADRAALGPTLEEEEEEKEIARQGQEEAVISVMQVVPSSELTAAEAVLVDTCSDPTEAALLVDTFKGCASIPHVSPYWGSSDVHLDALAYFHVSPARASPRYCDKEATDDAAGDERAVLASSSVERRASTTCGDFAWAFACFGDGDVSSMRDLERRLRLALEILSGLQHDHCLLDQRAGDLSSALLGLKQLRTARITAIRSAERALRAQLEATEKAREALVVQDEVATEAEVREEATLKEQEQEQPGGPLSLNVAAVVEAAIAAAAAKASSPQDRPQHNDEGRARNQYRFKEATPPPSSDYARHNTGIWSPREVVLSQHLAVAEAACAELSSLLLDAEKKATSVLKSLDDEVARVRDLTKKSLVTSDNKEEGGNKPLRQAKGKVARAYVALLLACDHAAEGFPAGSGHLIINEHRADSLARQAVGSLLPSVDRRLMIGVWKRLRRVVRLRRTYRQSFQSRQVQRSLRLALKTLRRSSVMKRVLRHVSSKQRLRSAFLGWVFGAQLLWPFKQRQIRRRVAGGWAKWLKWLQRQRHQRQAISNELHLQKHLSSSSSRQPLTGLLPRQRQRMLLRPKVIMKRVLREWQVYASKSWHAALLQALAFWCRSILRKWRRAAVASAAVLSLRADHCCAQRSLRRWRRALVLHRLRRRTQTRKHFLAFFAHTKAAHRDRELNNTAAFLGKRSLALRTWQRLRQHAVTCSAARRVMVRLTSVHAKQCVGGVFWRWAHATKRGVRQRETSALAHRHAAALRRRRAFGYFKRGVRHVTYLKTTLKLFLLACASLRVTRAFRMWLWRIVQPQRLALFQHKRIKVFCGQIFFAWRTLVRRSNWLMATTFGCKARTKRLQLRRGFGQWWQHTTAARLMDARATDMQALSALEQKARAIMVKAIPSWSFGRDDGSNTREQAKQELEMKLSRWLQSVEDGLHVAAKKGSGLAEEVKKWRRKVQAAQKNAISGHGASEQVQCSAQEAAAEVTRLEGGLATKVQWLKATEAAADLLRQDLEVHGGEGEAGTKMNEEETTEVELQASHAHELEELQLETTQCAQREQSARAELLSSSSHNNTTLGPQTHGGRVDLQAMRANKAEKDAALEEVAVSEAALNDDLVTVKKELKHAIAMGTTIKACQARDTAALHEATAQATALREHLTIGTEKVASLEERLRVLQSAGVRMKRTLQLQAQDEQEAQVALAVAARSALRAAGRGSARAARLVAADDDGLWKVAKKSREAPSLLQPISTSSSTNAYSAAPHSRPSSQPQPQAFSTPHLNDTPAATPTSEHQDTPHLMAVAASHVRHARAPLQAIARALAMSAEETAAESLASRVAADMLEAIVEFTVAESVATCVQHMGDSWADMSVREEVKHHQRQASSSSSSVVFPLKQAGLPLQIPPSNARPSLPEHGPLRSHPIRQKGRAYPAEPGTENQAPSLHSEPERPPRAAA